MTRKRFDLKHPRKYVDKNGDERTYWTKCGVAWELDDGGFALELSYVPVGADPETGKIKMIAYEQE